MRHETTHVDWKAMGTPHVKTTSSDRLLGRADVSEATGLCPTVASRLMQETGHCIRLHRHIYVLESDFLAYLRSMGGERING